MSEDRRRKFDWSSGPVLVLIGLAVYVAALSTFAMITAAGGSSVVGQSIAWIVLSGGCFAALVLLGVGVIRWALAPYHRQLLRQHEHAHALLQLISDNLTLSETAKRIAFREKDRQTLRDAIGDEMRRHDFDMALNLRQQLVEAFGNHAEAEQIRSEIFTARAAHRRQQLDQELTQFNDLLARHEWEQAGADAAKIEKQFVDMPDAKELIQQVKQAREQYKHTLERQFLEASQRSEVDLAMNLMKELDKYLSETETEPFREAARGVISKKRDNLAVQFKLALHDKEWIQAVRVGEEIVKDFANSKMAEEVNGMIDVLRERAAEQTV